MSTPIGDFRSSGSRPPDPARTLGHGEGADAETLLAVEPAVLEPEAGGAGELERLLERVLERILGVDRLAVGELDLEVERLDGDALLAQAHDLDLDPALLLAPGGAVREAADVEAGVELAVQALQQVEREARRDAGRVVVGALEHLLRLAQVDADEERVAGRHLLANAGQEAGGLVAREVPDARAEPEDELRDRGLAPNVGERGLELARERAHLERRVALEERERRRLEHAARDVDGEVAEPAVPAQPGLDQDPRLRRAPAPELEHRDRRVEARRDAVCARDQDLALGARQVVLGELADLLEELRALLVVAEAAGDRPRPAREARRDGRGEGLLLRRVLDQGVTGHEGAGSHDLRGVRARAGRGREHAPRRHPAARRGPTRSWGGTPTNRPQGAPAVSYDPLMSLRPLGAALRRIADAVPVTPRGLLVAALCAASLRVYGYGSLDLVVFALAVSGLALLAFAMTLVSASAFYLRRADRSEPARLAARLEADRPLATGYSLTSLERVPLATLDWSWRRPAEVRTRVRAEAGRASEEVTPTRRCEASAVARRFRVADAFGLARVAWEREAPASFVVLPAIRGLRRLTWLQALASGEGIPHPAGRPEGDRMEMRRYVPGDSVRHILWKVFARTRQLEVRMPERSVHRARRTLAYLVAGPDDEAAAAAARVALESCALGEAWLFGADGTEAPTDRLDAALRAIARSAGAAPDPGGDALRGLRRFLAAARSDGSAHCVVFAPASRLAGASALAAAARAGGARATLVFARAARLRRRRPARGGAPPHAPRARPLRRSGPGGRARRAARGPDRAPRRARARRPRRRPRHRARRRRRGGALVEALGVTREAAPPVPRALRWCERARALRSLRLASWLRAAVLALMAAILWWPLVPEAGVASGALAAAGAALAADLVSARARRRLRGAAVAAVAAAAALAGAAAAGLLVRLDAPSALFGPVAAVDASGAILAFGLTAPCVFALRFLAARHASAGALEVVLAGAALAASVSAHREGMVHLPHAVGDLAWTRGFDPTVLFLALGGAGLVLLAGVLLGGERGGGVLG